MIGPVILFITTVLFVLSQHVTAKTYYATPSSDIPCPDEDAPCMTLSQYANESPSYFARKTTLLLLPGNHSLYTNLTVAKMNHFALVGLNESTPHITCHNSALFGLNDITKVHVKHIATEGCGGNIVTFVEKFTLEHSTFLGSGHSGTGLGLVQVKYALIESCEFTLNTGVSIQFNRFGGGAIAALNSNVSIAATLFQYNSVVVESQDSDRQGQVFTQGGAIFAFQCTVIIVNSIFKNNTVADFHTLSDTITQQGGAIYTDQSSLGISNVTFTDNSANSGGAIHAENSSENFFLINSSFAYNEAPVGGAVSVSTCTLKIINCEFYSNHAISMVYPATLFPTIYGGGAVAVWRSAIASIENSTFSCNKAEYSLADFSLAGGAVYVSSGGVLYIKNCDFVGNTASFGGAIGVHSANVHEKHCTYTKNIGHYEGDAYFIQSSTNSTFERSICSGNGGSSGVPIPSSSMTIIVNASTLKFEEVTFSNNVGIVLFSLNSTVTLYDSTFINNEAMASIAVILINLLSSEMYLENCTFFKNTVGSSVMKIQQSSKVKAEGSNFIDNKNGDNTVFVYNSVFQAVRCNFSGNSAPDSGIIAVAFGALTVEDTLFFDNIINSQSGAIFCYERRFELQVNLTNTNFTQNSGGVIEAVACTVETHGYLYVARNNREQQDSNFGIVKAIQHSSVTLSGESTFVQNCGSMILAYGSNITLDGQATFTDNTLAKNNTYKRAGGITAIFSVLFLNGDIRIANHVAENGGAVVIKESQVYVTGNLTISNNTGSSGGGIYAYQSQLSFRGLCVIQGNHASGKGGGIHAIGSSFLLSKGSLQFVQNSATLGGGIFMEQNSNIYISKDIVEMHDCSIIHKPSATMCNSDPSTWLRLEFSHNSAIQYGGAVYVDDENSGSCGSTLYSSISASSECFIQTLQQYVTLSQDYLPIVNKVNTYFTGNSATEGGSAIYGGLLDRCTLDLYSEEHYTPKSELSFYIYNITNVKPASHSISSNASRVCFCNKRNQPDCSYRPPRKHVDRGLFGVAVAAVDQMNQTIPATIRSFVSSQDGGLGEGQASQNILQSCTTLNYSISSSSITERVILYADGPCKDVGISQNYFDVEFDNCGCPIGFQNARNCTCECDDAIQQYVIDCFEVYDSVLKNSDTWIGWVNDTDDIGFIIHFHCPFDYCSTDPVLINFNVPNGVDSQCNFNRSSMLCGACKEGYSLTLGSSRCMPCSNSWLSLLIVFALAGILLVAFLLIFNLTVATGTINGLIFYANIIVANRAIFFLFEKPNFLTVFISWLNLDFGIETCFYNGMDGYAKTWLQLLFPAYVILLVIAFIILCERSTKFVRYVAVVSKNRIAVLATLILLSYTKFLRVIIAALSFTKVEYPDGHTETVWLFDASVSYLKGKHIPLFLAAVVIIIFGLSYTLLLMFWQWIVSLKLVNKHTKFCSFMETYNGSHLPNSAQYRFWTGLLLFARIFLYLVSAVNVNGDPGVNLLAINSVMVGLLVLQHVAVQKVDQKKRWNKLQDPSENKIRDQRKVIMSRYHKTSIYNHWILDILEGSFFFNLIVFSCFTIYFPAVSAKKNREQLAYISTSVAFITFVGIIAYHFYAFAFDVLKALWSKCIKRRNVPQRPTHEPNSDPEQVANPKLTINAPAPEREVPQTEIDPRPPVHGEDSAMPNGRKESFRGGKLSSETTPLLSQSQRSKRTKNT